MIEPAEGVPRLLLHSLSAEPLAAGRMVVSPRVPDLPSVVACSFLAVYRARAAMLLQSEPRAGTVSLALAMALTAAAVQINRSGPNLNVCLGLGTLLGEESSLSHYPLQGSASWASDLRKSVLHGAGIVVGLES